MSGSGSDPRRLVPKTDAILAEPRVVEVQRRLGRALVKQAIVDAQQRVRTGELAPDRVVDATLAALPSTAAGSLTPVLNATGVLLHTNLGRAPLSDAAVAALGVAAGSCDVELDLSTGARGRRGRGALAALAVAVPAAGAVHVVNNGAAALALVATALAGPGAKSGGTTNGGTTSGGTANAATTNAATANPATANPGKTGAGTASHGPKEIVIARGELVEIGDGFRIPDLLAATGARLREVGTTNRVHIRDYAEVIGPETGFVLKVHPSNFRITGFTASVPVTELAGLGVPLVVDIGSGLLSPEPLLPDEPDAASMLTDGATLVTASGDKLLGGPQAGLLLGSPGAGAELVERLRRHPLARALRVDKLTLAALEATLAGPPTPTAQALRVDPAALHTRAEALAARLHAAGIEATAVEAAATVGGGGAPGVALPSAAVALPERYAAALRAGRPAVLGRLEGGRCLLDLRAIPPASDEQLYTSVRAVTSE